MFSWQKNKYFNEYHLNMEEMKLLALSRVFSNGQTQIPRDVRRLLKIRDGDKLAWYKKNDEIIVKKA